MDDDMEDEIIYELFSAHAHIIWRYLGVTTAGLIEMIVPGPGESYKTKIFQPGPFMFLMFLVIVASVVLQSSSNIVRQFMLRTHYALGLNNVGSGSFKTLGDLNLVSALGTDNVTWDFYEGIVGIYGMQGRRGNMEDRFRVIQDVDVGDKKMSFFGVFDGHGGQYTAEFVKEHLFNNLIEKIKQLRTQDSESDTSNKSKSSKLNNGSNDITKKTEKRGSLSTDKVLNGINKEVTIKNGDSDESTGHKVEKEATQAKNGHCKNEHPSPGEDESSGHVQIGSGVENLCSVPPETSMKKDDTYCTVNLKKRNSIFNNNNNNNNSNKEKKEDTHPDAVYIDNYKNVNYTRLLTDQIIAVDNQVVEQCKIRTDMSGTTAVIAVLDGELLIIGNVGDSRAVMGDTKGSTIPLSFDHKPNQLKERRRIKEAGGFITFTGVWRVAGILATSRALGDFPLKEPRKLITAEPDVLTFSLRDHKAHFVILATDGLWDVLTNEEAVAYVRDHIHEPDYGAKSLTLHAYYRGSQDNITVAILNIEKLGL
ncbi:Protein phosphatase 1L [Halocaridina rubra]|uniref:Protein phosphatase 1L n=1 Tax=Halocaridina rubra TaxID=373956 RepID=A0AAN8XI01_HALRR